MLMLVFSFSFLALARFGGICHSNDVASVVKENGLQTAYVIAHEAAHKLVKEKCIVMN